MTDTRRTKSKGKKKAPATRLKKGGTGVKNPGASSGGGGLQAAGQSSSDSSNPNYVEELSIAELEAVRAAQDAEKKKLLHLQEQLVQRKVEVEQQQEEVRQSKKDQAVKDRELNQRKKELAAEAARLDRAGASLVKRERLVAEREAAAEAGFVAKNRAALQPLEKQHDKLLQQIARLEESLSETRAKGQAALAKQLASARDAQEKEDDRQAAARRKAQEAQLNKLREEEEGRWAQERERLKKESKAQEEEIAALHKEVKTARAEGDKALDSREQMLEKAQKAEQSRLAAQEKELAERERAVRKEGQKLRVWKEELDEVEQTLEARIARRAEDRVRSLDSTLEQARGELERLRNERNQLQEQLDGHEEVRKQFGDKPEVVLRRLRDLKQDLERVEGERDSRPDASQLDRLKTLQAAQLAWDRERDQLHAELRVLQADQNNWTISVAELEQQRELREVAERRRQALAAEMDRLGDEVSRLRSLYDQPKEMEARIGDIEVAYFKSVKRAEVDSELTELGWLDYIYDKCVDSGLTFNRRLLEAFHTALKTSEWSPLAVLAGVSGTGKSELPRLYSRFGGLAFLPLSVQPNWDSPQALFGFFNSVDNRFDAQPLLRALVQLEREQGDNEYQGGLRDRLLLVLLDEMNLSHVELYFSDLLSKLELRRGELAEKNPLEVELGAGLEPYRLPLRRNVLWVGTMNEDETTKSLSDKVLDRANLISFPRPRTLRRRQKVELQPERPLLARETWINWQEPESDLPDKMVAPFKEALEQINEHLEQAGRALGHRVWQSIEHYMINHPRVRDRRLAGADAGEVSAAMNQAFEDGLVQRVMPKLRGIETSGRARTHCLDRIQEVLGEKKLGLNLNEDFKLACETGYGAFVWRSAHYLEQEKDG